MEGSAVFYLTDVETAAVSGRIDCTIYVNYFLLFFFGPPRETYLQTIGHFMFWHLIPCTLTATPSCNNHLNLLMDRYSTSSTVWRQPLDRRRQLWLFRRFWMSWLRSARQAASERTVIRLERISVAFVGSRSSVLESAVSVRIALAVRQRPASLRVLTRAEFAK